VFRAKKRESEKEGGCCPYQVSRHDELTMRGYNAAAEAYEGHLALCKEWSEKKS
jgi:hypothetical protein